MSRTIPRAYVTAAWNKNRVDAEDQARKYCVNVRNVMDRTCGRNTDKRNV